MHPATMNRLNSEDSSHQSMEPPSPSYSVEPPIAQLSEHQFYNHNPPFHGNPYHCTTYQSFEPYTHLDSNIGRNNHNQRQFYEPMAAGGEWWVLNTLKQQVEFYFSLENLMTDAYLVDQLMEHGGGVPCHIVGSFNRVRDILGGAAASPQVLQQALECSGLVRVQYGATGSGGEAMLVPQTDVLQRAHHMQQHQHYQSSQVPVGHVPIQQQQLQSYKQQNLSFASHDSSLATSAVPSSRNSPTTTTTADDTTASSSVAAAAPPAEAVGASEEFTPLPRELTHPHLTNAAFPAISPSSMVVPYPVYSSNHGMQPHQQQYVPIHAAPATATTATPSSGGNNSNSGQHSMVPYGYTVTTVLPAAGPTTLLTDTAPRDDNSGPLVRQHGQAQQQQQPRRNYNKKKLYRNKKRQGRTQKRQQKQGTQPQEKSEEQTDALEHLQETSPKQVGTTATSDLEPQPPSESQMNNQKQRQSRPRKDNHQQNQRIKDDVADKHAAQGKEPWTRTPTNEPEQPWRIPENYSQTQEAPSPQSAEHKQTHKSGLGRNKQRKSVSSWTSDDFPALGNNKPNSTPPKRKGKNNGKNKNKGATDNPDEMGFTEKLENMALGGTP